MPLSVTRVPERSSSWRLVSPARCFNPSSVTMVSRRFNRRRSLSPASPSSPLSLKEL